MGKRHKLHDRDSGVSNAAADKSQLLRDLVANADKIYDLVCDLDNMMKLWDILNWELAQTSPGDDSFKLLRPAMLGHHDATQRLFKDLCRAAER